MSERVVIIGAGGHGQVVADIVLAMQTSGLPIEAVSFVDDDHQLVGKSISDLPVMGTLDELRNIRHDAVIVAIGDNARRRAVSERLAAQGERLSTAIHPSAVIAPSSSIGPGSMVCAGVVVNPSAVIGESVILNTGCSIDHHNRIGSYAHIGPGARLGGTVSIGDRTLVGIGAVVLPGLTIGARTTIGGGAVVTKSVSDDVVVAGVPARVLTRADF